MSANTTLRKILVSMLIGLVIGIAVGEIPFILQRETARPPKTVTITIPLGTADRVAQGEQPPSIPENMTFVVGDVLVVENNDSADHKLGPLWIPARTSAQLALSQKENLAYECSFQPGKYFGLDVREPLTMSTRIFGIIYAGLPLGILIALYSFAFPSKKKENVAA
ncbi:MAG: hypothetical protein QM730_28815 [Anaerolineales bacterium]